MSVRTLIATVFTIGLAANVGASTIVPGTADPWLAGMPNGSTASLQDIAPGQSPIEVLLFFVPGQAVTFSATGLTDHCPGGVCGFAGPEGDAVEGSTGHVGGAENGIGDLIAPIDSLVGVFLGPGQPNLSPAPGGFLDFSTLASRDFVSLSPLLKQPFFIGDGLRNDGLSVQQFIVPAGATRLYLGTMDGFGWWNNSGSFEVTATTAPEPATIVLVGAGLFGAVRRRVRRR